MQVRTRRTTLTKIIKMCQDYPVVPAWFAIHFKSLQIAAITGKVWAKCGHGWARVAYQIIGRLRHFYKRV